MMEKLRYIFALMTVVLFATACQDDELISSPNQKPAAVGDEIVFGVRAGFEDSDPKSRTVYSGELYTVDGKTFERIDWVSEDDKIEIYSPEASAPGTDESNNSHYKIISGIDDSDDMKDYATLERLEDAGSSLQWQDDNTHTFYALYPSERMFDIQETDENGNPVVVTVDMGIELNGTQDNVALKGIVPDVQNPIEIIETAEGYEAKPDMRYAYMAAKKEAKREDGSVNLTFVPIVTAVEIELTLAEGDKYLDAYVGEIQITTKAIEGENQQPIAGDFTANLKDWTGTGYPKCTAGDNKKTQIQFTTRKYNENTGISEPLKLSPGQSLKFTVFMLPTQDLSDLVVKYSGTGAEAYRSKTLDLAAKGKSIPAHLKTRISKLNLPAITEEEEITIDASNWMSQLDQTTSMRKLSLPGTGGSFSYNYKTEADKKYYSQQTLTLEEQWKLGIRAFEVVVNRPSSSSTSLGGQDVKCNKTSVGVTFNTVMTDLTTWVSKTYPNECAVVILTYQPEGWSPARNASAFAGSLNTWYSSFTNKDVLKKYTPELTLRDAKGHVMVLVRLNQKDEKDDGDFTTASNTLSGAPFVLIDGCGTAKDRWGARGYKVNGTNFPHISNSYSDYEIIETFMQDGYLFSTTDGDYTTSNTIGNYTITRAAADTPSALNFEFQTNDTSTKCWYQEWARVVSTPYMQEPINGSWLETTTPNCYWFESYYEKLNNATVTYDMAVSDDYEEYIFINSLCGYITTYDDNYILDTKPSVGSAYGGDGGDIKGLADKITPAFYNHVFKRSQENTTGPTGIVMMDYLSGNPDDGGAYYLPGLIIANNFKHNK